MEGVTTTQGYAVNISTRRKMATHSDTCYAVELIFIPLIFKSLGCCGPADVDLIQFIGLLQSLRLEIPPAQTITIIYSIIFRGALENQCPSGPTESPLVHLTLMASSS